MMFVLMINGIDASCHSKEIDANKQKEIYTESGIESENITIVEKDTFEPL